MAKASIQLANGTSVQIEGSPDEVARVLNLYGDGGKEEHPPIKFSTTRRNPKHIAASEASGAAAGADLRQIVDLIKSCAEAESIEAAVLDKTSQLERILLPLYIVHEHLENAYGLTSGDISQITKELGIPVSQSNTSTTLSGTASKYIVGDKIRKKGQAVHYKIGRRGLQHVKSVLGEENKK